MASALGDEPHIRGALIGSGRDWIVKTYGRALFERARVAAGPTIAALVDSEIGAFGWFPLPRWELFLREVRREVLAATGENEETYDRRAVFETVGAMLSAYQFVFGIFAATTIVARFMPMYRRIYDRGTINILRNDPGYCVLEFSQAPLSMLSEILRYFPIATEVMLHLSGQETYDTQVLHTVTGDSFVVEVRVRYRRKKKA